MLGETEWEMNERRVRQGNRCVLRQRRLVRGMSVNDPRLSRAKQILELMERIQMDRLLHRRRLTKA